MTSKVKNVSSVLLLLVYFSLLLIITGCGGDKPNPSSSCNTPVALTEPISFSADESLFLSAEILNSFSEDQILKVVLPDSSILYRDLNSNRVWKEEYNGSKYVESKSLSESDLNMVLAIDLDTGWQPSSGPFQVRFILRASEGRLSASLDGDMILESYVRPRDDANDISLEVAGTNDGGTLHLEGGLEISARYRIGFHVNMPWPIPDLDWDYENDIPYFPNADWGVFDDVTFTPFMFGSSVECEDDIDDQDVTFPIVGLPDVLSLNLGAIIGGNAEGRLDSDSLYFNIGDDALAICTDGDYVLSSVERQGDSTTVSPSLTYAAKGHVKWDMTIRPAGQAVIDLTWHDIGISRTFTLTIGEIPITLFNSDVSMEFNKPQPSFVID